MKKKLIFLIIVLIIVGTYTATLVLGAQESYAAGGVIINFNNASLNGGPLFVVSNMMPGDCIEKQISIKNDTNQTKTIGTYPQNQSQTGNISSVLSMKIQNSGTTIYEKTLAQFFTESKILLATIPKNQSQQISFQICFNKSAGNEFQQKQAKFDLVFVNDGKPAPIPNQCGDLKIENIILGTDKNDVLKGTSKKDFIDGKAGNDTITGTSDDDCIVGGDGNDKLDGGSGKDYIWAGSGDDEIEARSGNDIVYAGPGNDKIWAGAGEDTIWGEEGNDQIIGDAGKETTN
jgi:Ca2+-binding RTX toxin-like protein